VVRAPRLRGRLARALLAGTALLCAAPGAARAGVLTRSALARYFPDPFVIGEREQDVPVWPIFRQSGPPSFTKDLVGYAFESVDLAPVPGFSGTPIDLLVAMNTNGEFIDVRVLSHHEPVFLGGVGQEPLVKFLTQYQGVSLKQNVKIGAGAARASRSGSTNVYLDGVAKATASVRIINQSVLSAALKVARAKLGYSGGRDPDLVAHVRGDLFEPRTWRELLESGLVQRLTLRNRDVEQAFAGTEAAGVDAEARARPDDVFMDLYAAVATVPSAGRNLLTDAGWQSMIARTSPGDHVLLVMSRGRYSFVGDDFVRNSVPDRLALKQSGLAIEMRDLDLDAPLRPVGQPALESWMAFRVMGHAGLDPGEPVQLSVRVTRSRGIVYPERIGRDFTLSVAVPARYLIPAAEDQKTWRSIWRARRAEIGVLLVALAFLGWVLARQSSLVTAARRLRWFRPAFLAFTLVFVGWVAQGQLSIVNIVALLQATLAGHSWTFFLYDPMSTILWIFALASLVVWGRGTFCGWLCPFGALQELVASLARLARVPRRRPSARADRRLKRVKYVVLAAVLAAAVVSTRWSDALVEVEPFKTAITVHFARAWPFAAYAVALVAAGAVVDKLFCRYLCPLGACLALAGRLRRFDWLPRRAECGKPCQTCRNRCDYQAIEADGRVDYAECFQCMECVAIHRSDELCSSQALARKGRQRLPIVAEHPGAR
jgi:NosR/NirI family transcriptional regulator, nitrous oxide reductase regulator